MNYGERLRVAREHKNWTQGDLEKATDGIVGQGTISKIERGDQGNSKYDIIIAHVLDIHPKWLYDGDERYMPNWLKCTKQANGVINDKNGDYWQSIYKSRHLKPDEIELLNAFDTMTQQQKDEIIALANKIYNSNKEVFKVMAAANKIIIDSKG